MERGAKLRRAISNVLLGVAVGLLSYYGLTTVSGWLSQRELRTSTPSAPVFSAPSPAEAAEPPASGNPLDFEGWEAQDQAYWKQLAPGSAFARIVIPAIGVDAIVVSGTATADLKKGPGWMNWTSLPGPSGTCGIAGHRTTYGAPFRRVDQLVPGDTVDLYSPFRLYRYRVLRTLIVLPSQTEVLHPAETPSLALSACHPPYSARYRIVVQAELVAVQRLDQPTGQESQ